MNKYHHQEFKPQLMGCDIGLHKVNRKALMARYLTFQDLLKLTSAVIRRRFNIESMQQFPINPKRYHWLVQNDADFIDSERNWSVRTTGTGEVPGTLVEANVSQMTQIHWLQNECCKERLPRQARQDECEWMRWLALNRTRHWISVPDHIEYRHWGWSGEWCDWTSQIHWAHWSWSYTQWWCWWWTTSWNFSGRWEWAAIISYVRLWPKETICSKRRIKCRPYVLLSLIHI